MAGALSVKELLSRAQAARHKQFLRGFYRQAAAAVPAGKRSAHARAVARRMDALGMFHDAQTVGLYVSVGPEVDTAPLFDLCRKARKAVAVPVVEPKTSALNYALVSGDTRWKKNLYGIPEPEGESRRLIDPGNVDLLVVPGRAFTSEGIRLGAGAGYYDRFMERYPRALTVGVAYDEQIALFLPAQPHDAVLDAVITPTRTFY
jgi:5-formyltetrahydrofolate cyclo-ligase